MLVDVMAWVWLVVMGVAAKGLVFRWCSMTGGAAVSSARLASVVLISCVYGSSCFFVCASRFVFSSCVACGTLCCECRGPVPGSYRVFRVVRMQ